LERPAICVERCRLLWILAVAKILKLAEIESKRVARAKESRDRRVVGRSLLEHPDRTTAAEGFRDLTALEFAQKFFIERRIWQRKNVTMIFRRGAQHRRPADIDLLDRFIDSRALARDRLLERIEIHHNEIDRRDAKPSDVREMFAVVAVVKNRAEYARSERFHAAAEDLRGARPGGDRRHIDSRAGEMFGRAAGRENLHSFRAQGLRQLDDSGFVGYREDRPLNSHSV